MESLADIKDCLGDRIASVAKEISKIHEDVQRGTLTSIIENLQGKTIAGEYVVMVEGFHKEGGTIEEALQEVHMLMKKGLGRKEAVKVVAESYKISKKELYDKSLDG